MSKHTYTNNTNNYQYPGGQAVPPGESREIPGYGNQEEAEVVEVEQEQVHPILGFAIKDATELIAKIVDIPELQELDKLEQAGQNRSGMLLAISERILALSNSATEGEPGNGNSIVEGAQGDANPGDNPDGNKTLSDEKPPKGAGQEDEPH